MLAKDASQAWLRALERTGGIGKSPHRILPEIVAEFAATAGDAPALISRTEQLSYRELAGRMNRYARWAQSEGIGPGETVGLMMPNRPDYVAIWLGITLVGGVVALLNNNLFGAPLAHAIKIADPKHVIVAGELGEQLETALGSLPTPLKIWTHGASARSYPRVDQAIENLSSAPLAASERANISIRDQALFIYTSGTTGLPKAARVSHYRILSWGHWFAGIMDVQPADRMYNCLPMYHSIGGVTAIGTMLVAGGSIAIAEKFSARQFWNDIADWDCSLFQYIGELCRYLVNTPTTERERQHRLRIVCGNGLRADIWEAFQARFAIPRILEFYAATEGNFSLTNVEGKPGAIGKLPSFLAHRFPAALVKFDIAVGEPVRNADGFCVRCGVDEPGEAIGRISTDSSSPGARFEGYSDAAATEKKILRNVFAAGDAWLRTGDLMRRDAQGFFYFVDRIGDTFRWKGENVATSEVAEALARCPGVLEANVYGVAVPGTEGRAGMAALVVSGDFDLARFRDNVGQTLPEYARPLFVRLLGEMDVTATFKHMKQDLVAEGFDPAATTDRLYFNDAKTQAFVPLEGALYQRILNGEVRL